MNILYGGDSGVCDGMMLSVLSLCKHVKEPLDVYIITASVGERTAVPPSFAEHLGRIVAARCGGTVTLLDITERFHEQLPLANMNTRFTPLCMLRLFADELSDIPDRVLYLDTDVMCRGDIAALYHRDIRGIDMAGVPDRYGKWFFGNILRHDYLNSGVLLLNMEHIRQSGMFAACRRMCAHKKMFMPDQSALNKLALKQKLPVCYNEQGRIRQDTVLKHFTTFFRFVPYVRAVTIKPWHVDKLHEELGIYEFDDILQEFQKERWT